APVDSSCPLPAPAAAPASDAAEGVGPLESESEPAPTAKPVAITAIDDSVSEVLSAALGARRAEGARCLGTCFMYDEDTGRERSSGSDQRLRRTSTHRGDLRHPAGGGQWLQTQLVDSARLDDSGVTPATPVTDIRLDCAQSVTFSSISVTSAAIGERSE